MLHCGMLVDFPDFYTIFVLALQEGIDDQITNPCRLALGRSEARLHKICCGSQAQPQFHAGGELVCTKPYCSPIFLFAGGIRTKDTFILLEDYVDPKGQQLSSCALQCFDIRTTSHLASMGCHLKQEPALCNTTSRHARPAKVFLTCVNLGASCSICFLSLVVKMHLIGNMFGCFGTMTLQFQPCFPTLLIHIA